MKESGCRSTSTGEAVKFLEIEVFKVDFIAKFDFRRWFPETGDVLDVCASNLVFCSFHISGQDSTPKRWILPATTPSENTNSDYVEKKTKRPHA